MKGTLTKMGLCGLLFINSIFFLPSQLMSENHQNSIIQNDSTVYSNDNFILTNETVVEDNTEGKDEKSEDEQKIKKNKSEQMMKSRLGKWKSDSKFLLSIVSRLRDLYKENENDSELQKENKAQLREKKYKEEFNKIKKEYYNKPFSLQAVMVRDVIPETILNKEGKKKRKEAENACKYRNAGCDYLSIQFSKNLYRYTVETGNYEILFTIPVPDYDGYSQFEDGIKSFSQDDIDREKMERNFKVEIILIVKSKEKALKFTKGDVMQLYGKFREMKHIIAFNTETFKIILTE